MRLYHNVYVTSVWLLAMAAIADGLFGPVAIMAALLLTLWVYAEPFGRDFPNGYQHTSVIRLMFYYYFPKHH